MDAPGRTILIVDDEPQNRKLLETLLQPEGYVTITANSGEEALRRHPAGTGFDPPRPDDAGHGRLRSGAVPQGDALTSNIPIIMVTAQTDRGALLDGLPPGPRSS